MTPDQLLRTAGLLGLFLTLAGCYALLWGAGRLHGSRVLAGIAYLSYAAQWATALALWVATPLALPWKVLLAASAAVCSLIPRLSLRYVQDLHESNQG